MLSVNAWQILLAEVLLDTLTPAGCEEVARIWVYEVADADRSLPLSGECLS
jgi:hypothetical protein